MQRDCASDAGTVRQIGSRGHVLLGSVSVFSVAPGGELSRAVGFTFQHSVRVECR